MATDLKPFHDAFFEESLEAIDDMESGLLNLDADQFDKESINTIFRGAHSIKGCSATFGFDDITTYVHVMETVLDEMRDEKLKPTRYSIDVLLKSLDILRIMIVNTKDEKAYDMPAVEAAHQELEKILAAHSSDNEPGPPQSVETTFDAAPIYSQWEIFFRPNLGILKTGNDPLRLIDALMDIGKVKVSCDTSDLLDFKTIDPEDCYLSWKILLTGESSKAKIEEIFEWVSDDSKLIVKPLQDSNSFKPQTSNTPQPSSESGRSTNTSNSSGHNTNSDAASIRVGIDKVDAIINMVGELVITQSMLDQLGKAFSAATSELTQYEKLRTGLIQLERNTRELQESVMRIRMLPISYVFNRVPRIVHDLSKKLGKRVEVKMTGEGTELDKTVLEKIGDPLVHLIRNSLDHGIEHPEVRRAVGKPDTGQVSLNAFHKGGNIIVQIKDDGAGLNREKILKKAIQQRLINSEDAVSDEQLSELIFHPGLTTADKISDVSGRGVGMDVVKKNIKALGGNIEVKSIAGRGSEFTIRLPLTLAILDGQLVRVGTETYILPLVSIVESLKVKQESINVMAGQSMVYKLREEHIPYISLYDTFNIEQTDKDKQNQLLVIVESDGKRVGLAVDEILAQQQVVIKSLEKNFKRVGGLSGATILGDGTVALIADVAELIALSQKNNITDVNQDRDETINHENAA